MDVRMKFKNPITWPRKWLKIDKQVQQNLCFWCSRLELYGRDVVLPRPCMWKRSQASFKCNKYSTNKRKKAFTGAMERNPWVEEKEKKARCLWWSIQANIKLQCIFWVNESSRTQIFWREVLSEEWEEGGISFRAKRATPKVVYHSVSTQKCPDFLG